MITVIKSDKVIHNMKKVISLITVAVMLVLTLCSCGDDGKIDESALVEEVDTQLENMLVRTWYPESYSDMCLTKADLGHPETKEFSGL